MTCLHQPFEALALVEWCFDQRLDAVRADDSSIVLADAFAAKEMAARGTLCCRFTLRVIQAPLQKKLRHLC